MTISMRLILTTSILTLLAQPAWAQTVYYCSMTNLVEIDRQISRYQPERFKMSVTEEYVHFGSGGYLDGGFMHVREKSRMVAFALKKDRSGHQWRLPYLNHLTFIIPTWQ